MNEPTTKSLASFLRGSAIEGVDDAWFFVAADRLDALESENDLLRRLIDAHELMNAPVPDDDIDTSGRGMDQYGSLE